MTLSFNHLKVIVGGPTDAGVPLGTTIDMAGTEPASWNSQLDPSGNGYFSEGAFITVKLQINSQVSTSVTGPSP